MHNDYPCNCPNKSYAITIGMFRQRYGILESEDTMRRMFDRGELHGYIFGKKTRKLFICDHNLRKFHVPHKVAKVASRIQSVES